jgi:hypothetical protein
MPTRPLLDETVFQHLSGQASMVIEKKGDVQPILEPPADPCSFMQMGVNKVGPEGAGLFACPAVEEKIKIRFVPRGP